MLILYSPLLLAALLVERLARILLRPVAWMIDWLAGPPPPRDGKADVRLDGLDGWRRDWW